MLSWDVGANYVDIQVRTIEHGHPSQPQDVNGSCLGMCEPAMVRETLIVQTETAVTRDADRCVVSRVTVVQLEGTTDGWISAGVVDDNLKMVASPTHKVSDIRSSLRHHHHHRRQQPPEVFPMLHQVMVLDSLGGSASMVSMSSYDSSGRSWPIVEMISTLTTRVHSASVNLCGRPGMDAVDMSSYAAVPLLLLSASGKLLLRYRQVNVACQCLVSLDSLSCDSCHSLSCASHRQDNH